MTFPKKFLLISGSTKKKYCKILQKKDIFSYPLPAVKQQSES